MRRHVILGRYGSDDSTQVELMEGELATNFKLVSGVHQLGNGIGRALKDLWTLGVYPSEIGIDLLVFAAHVHAADTRIARRSEAQDGWTREIRLIIPVSDPALWTKTGSVFVRMLNFLTGDLWQLDFRARPQRFAAIARQRPDEVSSPFDNLSLFSGGLDSLIGAIDALENGRKPLLVSHAGEGATSQAQAEIFDKLKAHYQGVELARLRLWMRFRSGFVSSSTSENTTRSRSFLFFAVGIFAGTGFGKEFKLQVPENGLIAINVPLDPLRLGALSTRTTHPFYIARWNQVLTNLGILGQIENPYWNRTKGEMVSACANKMLLLSLTHLSLSCASPTKGRWQHHGVEHCGYCLPCLIRRAALIPGLHPEQDPTVYTLANLSERPIDSCASEGKQLRSFQLAVKRLQERPELASILIHKPGPLTDESPERQAALAEVYRRGLREVEDLLVGVRTQSR